MRLLKFKIIALLLIIFSYNSCKNEINQNEYCTPTEQYNYRTFFNYIPKDIKIYFNLNNAIKASEKQNKPILIIFTGLTCKSTKEIDWQIIKKSGKEEYIKNNFIISLLIVDDRTKLKNIDTNNTKTKTVGNCYSNMQLNKYNSNTQPLYCIVDNKLNDLTPPIGYTNDSEIFKSFIAYGIKNSKKNNQI